jgi:hypothetical protein
MTHTNLVFVTLMNNYQGHKMGVNTLPQTISNNDYFTGRSWLVSNILDWFEQTDKRLLLLTGKPGAGKSSVIAWLAGYGPAPLDPNARNELVRLREIVAAGVVYFCQATSRNYTPEAFATKVADLLKSSISEFADASAAPLTPMLNVNVNVTIAQPGSIVQGANIENLLMANRERVFDEYLTYPLQKLYSTEYNRPLLLLVDALDEAQINDGDKDLPSLLARVSDWPKQVRILATARPDIRLLRKYPLPPDTVIIDLFRNAPQEVNDIKDYVDGRLKRMPYLSEKQQAWLAQQIIAKAEDTFLYPTRILDDLQSRPHDIPDLEHYDLPVGLNGMYREFLGRELGRGDNKWYSAYAPPLGLLAVAQGEGLTGDQIVRILDTSLQELVPVLRTCSQYLTGTIPHGPFLLFHKSFADFLTRENNDLYIEPEDMHRLIAKYYYSKWTNLSRVDDYAYRHLVYHANRAKENAMTQELIFNFEWLQSKLLIEDVSVYDLIDDYDMAEGETNTDEVGLVKEVLQLAIPALLEDKNQLASQLIGRIGLFNTEDKPLIARLLGSIPANQKRIWLRPLTSSLMPQAGH